MQRQARKNDDFMTLKCRVCRLSGIDMNRRLAGMGDVVWDITSDSTPTDVARDSVPWTHAPPRVMSHGPMYRLPETHAPATDSVPAATRVSAGVPDMWREYAVTDSTLLDDPMMEMLDRMEHITTMEGLMDFIYPFDLLHGLEDTALIKDTVKRRLSDIVHDDRNHVLLGTDDSFCLRKLTTRPHDIAIAAIASANQWPPEAVHQGFCVMVGWTEHPGTRLVDDASRARAATIGAFFSGPPRIRKVSLHRFINEYLLSHPDLDIVLREGRACVENGGIVHHRACIERHCRSGISTPESSNCYEDTRSDPRISVGGIISKPRIVRLMDGERATCVPGHGDFSFLHYVMGNIPNNQQILMPCGVGFPKRFHQVWCTAATLNGNQNTHCNVSVEFLREQFGWMGKNATPFRERHSPDERALNMLKAVVEAVDEFVANPPFPLGAAFLDKLSCADIDIHKFANVAMRSSQLCATFTRLPLRQPGHGRTQWNEHEAACAIYHWFRQLETHHAFYRWSEWYAQAFAMDQPSRARGRSSVPTPQRNRSRSRRPAVSPTDVMPPTVL